MAKIKIKQIKEDTPSVMGMVTKVRRLVEVTNA